MPHQTQLRINTDPSAAVLLPRVVISTDGGCFPNPGVGGWSAVLRQGSYVKEISGYELESTNNRAELLAVLEALRCLTCPSDVTISSDSREVVVSFLNGHGMKAHKRKHQDLIQPILAAMRPHKITAIWIRGHNGDLDNERCDQLAMLAIRQANSCQ